MKYILLLLLAFSFNVLAEIVDIDFEPPTEREDGTLLPASEIAGYEVFDNGTPLLATDITFTGNSVAADFAYGKHNITIRTVDIFGRVSVDSIPFSFVLNANPKAPVIIKAVRRK